MNRYLRRRGSGDIYAVLLVGVIIVVGIVALIAANRGHHRKHRKEHVQVYHLKDGRYCYKHHDKHSGDVWYWLYWTNTSNGNSGYYTSSDSSRSNFAPPAGATWVSSQNAPSGAIVESAPSVTEMSEIAESINETVVTDARGCPEVDADGNVVDADQLAPDSAFDAPADGSDIGDNGESSMGDSSGSGDGSSGDAGGSDGSGGGDGGGGDGGGGD